MELKIGIGIDNIAFGINQEQLKKIMGDPDKINPPGIEAEDVIVYYYNDKMLKFKFDLHESKRLFSIEVFNPESIMFDTKLIGLKKDKVEKLLKEKHVSQIEHEDYVSFDVIHSDQISTTFIFEFARLVSIEIFPLFIDEETVQWPN